jgi:hypothetical protein
MKAITKLLAGGVAIAALAGAAPAAAQYYPGYGSPYAPTAPYAPGVPYGMNPYSPGVNRQAVISQCANAVQARLGGGYGQYGYNEQYGYGGAYGQQYGYGQAQGYGGGRVLGISRVEQRENGGLVVRGVASSGRYGGYAYGYGQAQAQPDLVWSCRTDFRGAIVDIDVNAAQRTYGGSYQNDGYTPWTEDYSQYGYQRY